MSKKVKDASEMGVVIGSGNVFADLGLPNAEEEFAKAELAFAIRQRIQEKRLCQTEAAALLGTDQAKVSLVMNGKVGGFTFDRLVRFLNALEVDVCITIKPTPDHQRGKTSVGLL
jgi:predicted XRE-type DNA-binding protein